MPIVKTGQLSSIPAAYAILRYPKGTLLVWISSTSVGLENLLVGMPGFESNVGATSVLMGNESDVGKCITKQLVGKLSSPVFFTVDIGEIEKDSMSNLIKELLIILS